jgi:hypothetical protein
VELVKPWLDLLGHPFPVLVVVGWKQEEIPPVDPEVAVLLGDASTPEH